MDSEHRHELKENDLAEFLTNFGQWWSNYGMMLSVVVLAAVAIIVGKTVMDANAAAKKEQAWADLAGSTSPESYSLVAQLHTDPAVRALGNLRAADLVTTGPTLPQTDNTQTDQPDAAIEFTEKQAADMYKQVIDDEAAHTVYKLNARLGLAAIAENSSDWDQAKNQYQQTIDQAGTAYAALATHARKRLELLDKLTLPVVFAPEAPKPRIEDQPLPTAAPPMPGVSDFGDTQDTDQP